MSFNSNHKPNIRSLYKYAPINPNTIHNLKQNQIYCSSPSDFNDPYEFIFKLDVKEEIYDELIKVVYGPGYCEVANRPKDEILEHIRDSYFTLSRKGLGLSCFTENENNDLMWAHYANNHRGICLEYGTDKPPFNSFQKVAYVDNIYIIAVDNITTLDNDFEYHVDNIYLRKNAIWSYENEWRLLFAANSSCPYPPDALKSITFGFFCDKDKIDCVLRATSHLDLKYYQVVRSKDSYNISKWLLR